MAMKVLCVAIAVGSACASVSDDFEAYKARFNKHYSTEKAEARAAECWKENVAIIAEQDVNASVTYAENTFSDQCWEDFRAERIPEQGSNGLCWKTPGPTYDKKVDPKKSVDWVAAGYVTPVKSQGGCGSCWAFSAIGCMEGAHFKASGKLLELSEQELVSCDTGGDDKGCGGGGPDTAFDWVIKNGGIATESDYPYVGKDIACDGSKETKAAKFAVRHYVPSRNKDEYKLLAALQNEGPISIVLQATQNWQQYSGGVLTASACGAGSGTDHAVLAVGYGFEGSQAYYKVKNSWGSSWGEGGYVRLAYNQNTCNVAVCYSYFITANSSPSEQVV